MESISKREVIDIRKFFERVLQNKAAIWPRKENSGELAVTQINCSDNVEICKEYKIYKYPSIQLFGDGKLIREYPDWMPRKSFHFKKFIEEAINPQLSFKGFLIC